MFRRAQAYMKEELGAEARAQGRTVDRESGVTKVGDYFSLASYSTR